MRRIVVVPDTQIPFDDRRMMKAVIRFIGDFQPDEVIHIGDLMDYHTPSRWSKGSAEEYALKVKLDNEQAKKRFFDPLREVYQGPVGVHEGNHDERPRVYLTKYAPALAEFSDQFHIRNMLDFDGFGVELLPDFNHFAPGWMTTHGHLGGIALSRIGANTALGAAKKFSRSVVMGHTHRLGVLHDTSGVEGQINRSLTGVEVGHLMDQKLAGYLKGGTANWQTGFCVLSVEGKHVRAETVPIDEGHFIVDGNKWEV